MPKLYGAAAIEMKKQVLEYLFHWPILHPWDRTFLLMLLPELDHEEHDVAEGSQKEWLGTYALLSQFQLHLFWHSFTLKSTPIVLFSGPGIKKEILFLTPWVSTNFALWPSVNYLYILSQNRRNIFTLHKLFICWQANKVGSSILFSESSCFSVMILCVALSKKNWHIYSHNLGNIRKNQWNTREYLL